MMVYDVLLVILGFAGASLIALFLAPPLWRRAVRVTSRDIENQYPMGFKDLQALFDAKEAKFKSATSALREDAKRVMVENSQHEKIIQKKQREIDHLLERIDKHLVTVNDREQGLREKDKHAEQLELEIRQRNQEIADLRSILAHRERESDEALKNLVLTRKDLKNQNKNYEGHVKKIEILKDENQNLKAALTDAQSMLTSRGLSSKSPKKMESRITAQEQEIERLNLSLKEHDSHIATLKSERIAATSNLASLREEVSQKTEQLSSLLQEKTAADKASRDQGLILAHQSDQLKQLADDLKKRNQQMDELKLGHKAQIQPLADQIGRLTKEAGDNDTTARNMAIELEVNEAAAAVLKQQIQELRDSLDNERRLNRSDHAGLRARLSRAGDAPANLPPALEQSAQNLSNKKPGPKIRPSKKGFFSRLASGSAAKPAVSSITPVPQAKGDPESKTPGPGGEPAKSKGPLQDRLRDLPPPASPDTRH